jgi:hypothetical protein
VYRINGLSGSEVEAHFRNALQRSSHLQALNPILNGATFAHDLATHLNGVSEAFDTLIREAQEMTQHSRNVEIERQNLQESQRLSAVDRFKRSQGIT